MVDLKILKERGVSSAAWKPLFEAEKKSDGVCRFIERLRLRIQQGRTFCFDNYRLYYALDQIFDSSFRQLTPTLAQAMAQAIANVPDDNQVAKEHLYKTVMDWGLSHLMLPNLDPKTGKPLASKRFSLPIFFNIIIPIGAAYTMIRVAKLVNDRLQDPFLKYEPFRSTPKDRLRCEIITDWIRLMTKNYGFVHTGSQGILKSAVYGDQLMMPLEEWHEEKQLRYVNGSVKEQIIREGMRFTFPHPSRTYIDRTYANSSINTDTGCEYYGFWRVQKAGDVRRNPKIWNRDVLQFPASDLCAQNPAYFNTVYKSCAVQFPQTAAKWSELDRENNQVKGFYTTDWDDYAIVLTEHFEKFNPDEFGLGDYDYPIWSRWLVGNDADVVYGCPLPSSPGVYFGYAPEDGKSLSSSLLLELTPFQDHLSNLFTQTLICAKQNLANLTFVDEQMVPEEVIRQIERLDEQQYRHLNLFRYSSMRFRVGSLKEQDAVRSIQLPKHDTNQLIYIINAMLGVLERVNVISAQEVGASGPHEESAEEIKTKTQSVSTKARYFSFQINKAFDAWKTLLYNYSMAFSDEEVWAQIPSDSPLDRKTLEAMGFTIEDDNLDKEDGQSKSVTVRGKKTALELAGFASSREGEDRINNAGVAAAMVQAFGMALGNQMLAEAIGPQQAIKLFNQILVMFGLPRDYRFTVSQSASPQAAVQEMQQQLPGIMAEVRKFVIENDQAIVMKIKELLGPISEASTIALQTGQKNTQAIEQLTATLQQLLQPPPSEILSPPPLVGPGEIAPQELVGVS